MVMTLNLNYPILPFKKLSCFYPWSPLDGTWIFRWPFYPLPLSLTFSIDKTSQHRLEGNCMVLYCILLFSSSISPLTIHIHKHGYRLLLHLFRTKYNHSRISTHHPSSHPIMALNINSLIIPLNKCFISPEPCLLGCSNCTDCTSWLYLQYWLLLMYSL